MNSIGANAIRAKSVARNASGDVRSECDRIFKEVKNAVHEAIVQLQSLLYMAHHGEFKNFSGDAERYIEGRIKVLQSNPLAR